MLCSLRYGLVRLHKYTSTRALDGVHQTCVTQSRVIPFA